MRGARRPSVFVNMWWSKDSSLTDLGIVPLHANGTSKYLVDQTSACQPANLGIANDATHSEVVGELTTRSNTALRYLKWSIHVSGTIHVQSVEMQRGGLVAQLIVDVNNDLVTNRTCHHWQRPLVIDTNSWSHELSIRIRIDPGDVEVVSDCLGDCSPK